MYKVAQNRNTPVQVPQKFCFSLLGRPEGEQFSVRHHHRHHQCSGEEPPSSTVSEASVRRRHHLNGLHGYGPDERGQATEDPRYRRRLHCHRGKTLTPDSVHLYNLVKVFHLHLKKRVEIQQNVFILG